MRLAASARQSLPGSRQMSCSKKVLPSLCLAWLPMPHKGKGGLSQSRSCQKQGLCHSLKFIHHFAGSGDACHCTVAVPYDKSPRL